MKTSKTITKKTNVPKGRKKPTQALKPVKKAAKVNAYIVKDKLVESWEEACKITERNPKHVPIVKHLPVQDRRYTVSAYKLPIIYEAQNINDGFSPDYSDPSQWKHTAGSFVKKGGKHPSGFVFSDSYYGHWSTYTFVGARLSVKSGTRAMELEKQFADLHLDVKFPDQPKRNSKNKK